MNLIDIGVNFHSSQLKGLSAELLSRATGAGVTHILATGTSLRASELALAFARSHNLALSRTSLIGVSPAHRTLARALGARHVPG